MTQGLLIKPNSFYHRRFYQWLLIVIAFATVPAPVLAQPENDSDFITLPSLVKHIESLNDKSLGTILAIYQSSDGLIWLGSTHGLIRFNGIEAKIYRHDKNDSNSLSGNGIHGIVEDKNHFLWISTYHQGLNKFDPVNDTFEHFKHDPNNPQSISANETGYLSFLTPDIMTVVTTKGVNLFDINQHTAQKIPLPNSSAAATKAMTDSQGKLWISTYNHGVYYYDPLTQTSTHFNHQPDNPNSLSSNTVIGIAEDNSGDLWFATRQGLNRLNPLTLNITRYNANHTGSDNLSRVFKSHDGTLWIGSRNGDVSRYSADTNSFKLVKLGPSTGISCIFEDKNHLMWFGTGDGLIKFGVDNLIFSQFTSDADNPAVITSSTTGGDHKMWLGSPGGLYQFDEKQLTVKKQPAKLKISHLVNSGSSQVAFHRYPEGGMTVIKPQTDQQKAKQQNHYDLFDPSNDKRYTEVISSVLAEGQTVWFTLISAKPNQQSGLYQTDTSGKKAEQLLSHHITYDVIRLSPSTLLLATFEGLVIFNQTNRQFSYVNKDAKSRVAIRALHKDAEQRIWLGYGDEGLGLFDPVQQKVTVYPWVDDRFVSIISDQQGDLWLAGNGRLLRFDPRKSTFDVFDTSMGVPGENFLHRAATKTPLGALMFSNAIGLLYFQPAELKNHPVKANTIISDFKLLNRSVKRPLNNQLTLTHEDYLFSFGFATLDYLAPEKRQYAYKMQGLDKDWLTTDAKNRTATYTTLPPGQYTFKVKGNDHQGQWNNGSSIKITILSPWWATSGAYSLYILLLLALIALFYRIRTTQLRQRAKALEQGIEQRTFELKQQAKDITGLLEDKNRLLQDKERLFANISHEFRTPLTLILGPLEKVLNNASDKSHQSLLTLAKNNGQRLLNMVDQLLDLARLQQPQQPVYRLNNVLVSVEFLLASYRTLAEERQVELTLDNQLEHDIWLNMQTDALEKILSNLLSNAFKYAFKPALSQNNKQQTITLTLKTDTAGLLMISVRDTGEGISEADCQQVFDRFTRLDNSQGDIPGAGIGLALVKELVEQHQGSISVQSQLHVGSTFTVTLPVAADAQNHSSKDTASQNHPSKDTASHTSTVNEALILTAVEQIPMTSGTTFAAKTKAKAETKAEVDLVLDSQQATILVVEDHHDMRQYILSCLTDSYHCMVADNGKQGLQLAQEHLPDLIVSDVMMPKMDGFALTKALKSHDDTSHIPVILLTARGDRESRIEGWSQKADEFLQKPFDVEELLSRINNLLSLRSLLRQRYQKEFSEPRLSSDHLSPASEPLNPIYEHKNEQKTEQPINVVHQAFIDKIDEILEKNYADEDFAVSLFADEMALGSRQLIRKMKTLLDLTPVESIRSFRLKKAAEHLASGIAPSEVYHRVGFSSHSYFSQCFKAQYKCLPSQFREKQT